MKSSTIKEILEALDQFSDPLTNLSHALQKVEDDDERKKYRRVVAEVMGLLDGEIAFPLRQKANEEDSS